ncbi:MAG: vWA domain-containing protein [Candidatus Odinarchaeia archaeon]
MIEGVKAPDDSKLDNRLILAGRVSDEQMLKAEIRIKGQAPRKYERLAKKLKFPQLKNIATYAIEQQNVNALSGIAKVNPYAVSAALFMDEKIQILGRRLVKESGHAPDLYFLLRGVLNKEQKALFRRLARSVILKSSSRIAGVGYRGEIYKRVQFYPGVFDIDLEETIENVIEQGVISYDTIVGVERRTRRKTGVLIVDTSGSMIENKITIAALAAAIMAYHMRNDNYAIVIFNTLAYVVKSFAQKVNVDHLVDSILDTTAAGYTNIYDGLMKGLVELQKVKDPYKWAILVTDGVFNRGKDPLPLARKYPRLNVIGLPSNDPKGPELCEKMARLGKGRYLPLKNYKDIPMVLSKILKKPI